MVGLVLCTVWLTVCLGVAWNIRWAAGFLALSAAVWALADISWRGYLVAALTLQLLVIVVGITDSPRAATNRTKLAATVTAAGIVWLSVAGGPKYWIPLVVFSAPILVIAGFTVARRRSRRHRPPVAPRPAREPGPPPTWEPAPWPTWDLLEPRPATERNRLAGHSPSPTPTSRPRDASEEDSGFGTGDDYFFGLGGLSPTVRPARQTPAGSGPDDVYFAMPADAEQQPAPAPGTPRDGYLILVDESVAPPPADVLVVARPSAAVRVSGLAGLRPPGTVEVRDSVTAVAGDGVKVHLKEHIRIRRVEISLDDLLTVARKAVTDFRKGGSVTTFQQRLRTLLPRPDPGDRESEVAIQPRYQVDVRRCRYVHLGDGARTDIDSRVVLERAVLPLGEMLVADAGLCERFRTALLETGAGPGTTAFLRDALRVADHTGDDELIRSARAEQKDARLEQLFGIAHVRGAALVVVGADNRLRQDMNLRSPGFDREALSAEIDTLRPDRQAAWVTEVTLDHDSEERIPETPVRHDAAQRKEETWDSIMDRSALPDLDWDDGLSP